MHIQYALGQCILPIISDHPFTTASLTMPEEHACCIVLAADQQSAVDRRTRAETRTLSPKRANSALVLPSNIPAGTLTALMCLASWLQARQRTDSLQDAAHTPLLTKPNSWR